jgi:Fe-S-cluster-containing hydrogenase component 2
MKILVNEKRCPQDHVCPAMKVCPVGAISQTGYNAPTIDQDKCIKCKKCALYCPKGAFQTIEV